LEGGVSALVISSGSATTTYAIQNISKTKDHIVSGSQIYGGTFNLLDNRFSDIGTETIWVDGSKPENFEKAIKLSMKINLL
jgi:O-acetylhomoserine (thiol)-lyase